MLLNTGTLIEFVDVRQECVTNDIPLEHCTSLLVVSIVL